MIIFRCDASAEIGLGHLNRCRGLAFALRKHGVSSSIYGPHQDYQNYDDTYLFDIWEHSPWGGVNNEIQKNISLAKHFNTKTFILDDYRVDERYQKAMKQNHFKWAQFESRTHKPIMANIVINFNPASKEGDYVLRLKNSNIKFLLGPSYAILRPEFDRLKPKYLDRPIHRILLTFGGGDDCGAFIFVLSSLLPRISKNIKFIVVLSSHNPNNEAIIKWIKEKGDGCVEIKINPTLISSIFNECDLAITNGGTTIYEVAACGLPMIIIATAENQINQAIAWSRLKTVKYLGTIEQIQPIELVKNFLLLCNQKNLHKTFQHENLVDLKGADRVTKNILNTLLMD